MLVFVTKSPRKAKKNKNIKKTKLVKRLIMSKYPNKRKFQNFGLKESYMLN